MNTLQDLYELIAALNSSEIEYFRLFAISQPGGPTADQATLFDALVDETRKSSGHVSRIEVEPEVAEGLTRQLRRSLRYLCDEQSIQSQIRSRIAEAQMLQDKRLYAQSDATFRQAHALARRFERFYELLEIINWQKASLQRILSLDEAVVQRLELEALEREALEKLNNYIAYRNAAKAVSEIFRRPEQSPDGSPLESLELLFQQPLLRDAQAPRSLTAQTYFLHLRSTYSYYIGDLGLAWNLSNELMELLRRHPFLIDVSQDGFMVSFFNFLALSLELGEYALFEEKLDEFRRMPETLKRLDSPMFRQLVLERSVILELKYFLFRGLFDEGIERCQLVAQRMREGLLRPDPYFEAQIYYLFAYFHYIGERRDEARNWLDRILEVPEFRNDVRINAIMLRHILAFEAKDGAFFERELPQTLLFLEHTRLSTHAERALLKTLALALKDPDSQRVVQRFERLREEMLVLRSNPFERNQLSSFDALSWLESHISGQSFKELFSRRDSAEKFRIMR